MTSPLRRWEVRMLQAAGTVTRGPEAGAGMECRPAGDTDPDCGVGRAR